jgi:hypothetical protein
MPSTVSVQGDSLTPPQVRTPMLRCMPPLLLGPSSLGMLILNTHMYPPPILVPMYTSSINNQLGSRLTLLLGTTGYSLYIGSFLCVNA